MILWRCHPNAGRRYEERACLILVMSKLSCPGNRERSWTAKDIAQ